MSNVRKMIAWASGMVEFIGDQEEPDGAIVVCTARGTEAIEELLDTVRQQTLLYDFGDQVGLRVPEINPRRTHDVLMPDFEAVDALIMWESYVRDELGDGFDIIWTRP